MGAVVWAEQLCRAVCFLHRHRIIHRDIKPDNITIDEETHQLTLVDLSAAEYIPEGSSFIIGAEGDGAPGAAVGTSGWVHPVIEGWLDTGSGESYDERKVDMWAIGRVLGGYVAEQEYVGQGSRMILREFGWGPLLYLFSSRCMPSRQREFRLVCQGPSLESHRVRRRTDARHLCSCPLAGFHLRYPNAVFKRTPLKVVGAGTPNTAIITTVCQPT